MRYAFPVVLLFCISLKFSFTKRTPVLVLAHFLVQVDVLANLYTQVVLRVCSNANGKVVIFIVLSYTEQKRDAISLIFHKFRSIY